MSNPITSTGGVTSYWCVRCGKQIGTWQGCCTCPPIIQPPPLPQYGWICPKCGRGNAPFKYSCDCTAISVYGTTAPTPSTQGESNG